MRYFTIQSMDICLIFDNFLTSEARDAIVLTLKLLDDTVDPVILDIMVWMEEILVVIFV